MTEGDVCVMVIKAALGMFILSALAMIAWLILFPELEDLD